MVIDWKELLNEFKYIISVIVLIIIVSAVLFIECLKPDDMIKRLSDGEKLVNEKHYVQALIHFSDFVRDYPNNYYGHLHLGDLYLKNDDYDNAKIEYYRAMELGKNKRFDGYFKLAKIYLDLNSSDIALRVLEPLQKNYKPEVLANFGDFYVYWGKKYLSDNPEESIRKFKDAYEFYKNSHDKHKIEEGKHIIAETYANIAYSLIYDGKDSEAEDILNISLKLFENAPAYAKLGSIYRYKDINDCVKYYDKAYKLDPNSLSAEEYTSALILKAEYLEEKGLHSIAKIYIEKAEKVTKQYKENKEKAHLNKHGSGHSETEHNEHAVTHKDAHKVEAHKLDSHITSKAKHNEQTQNSKDKIEHMDEKHLH